MCQQAGLAHTIQRDKGKLAQDLPLASTALLSSFTQQNAQQARTEQGKCSKCPYSQTSGSKIIFIQRTVNFGKALPKWGKKTDYLKTEKSDVGKKTVVFKLW